MKKLILLLSFLIVFKVHAGDLPESLLLLEDTDVFIGEITEIKEGQITITVSSALFENYDIGEITVDEFLYMTDDKDNILPQEGDFLAAAVAFRNGKMIIAYSENGGQGLVVKSDGLDPETLRLFSGDTSSGFGSFAARMNTYINDGTYSKENRAAKLEMIRQEESGKSDAAPTTPVELDGHSIEIIRQTEIVTPPPDLGGQTKESQQKKPLSRYVVLTISSAAIGFFVSRSVATRQRNRNNR